MGATISAGQQKQIWTGSIDKENGVHIVRNPIEPFFGAINFELDEALVIKDEQKGKYRFFLLSRLIVDEEENIFGLDVRLNQIFKFNKEGKFVNKFGRRGQGPGEFERPAILYIDKSQQIYVSDMRKIHVFNNTGEYVKGLTLNYNFTNFFCDRHGNIIALSHVATEEGTKKSIIKFDNNGKKKGDMADFKTVQAVVKKGKDDKPSSLTVYHEYNYLPHMYPKGNSQFYYGYPSEYKLNLMDNSGNLIMVIEKEEPPQSISKREKNHIVDEIGKRLSRMNRQFPRDHIEKACKFPTHRPFFNGFIADENGMLFVARVNSVLEEEDSSFTFDIFSSEGIYLYKAILPFMPSYIDNGCIYRKRVNDDSGETDIVKYKVTNWTKLLRKPNFR